MRDYGPTFLTRQQSENPLAFNDWIFNGWGAKYPAYEQDERVAQRNRFTLASAGVQT